MEINAAAAWINATFFNLDVSAALAVHKLYELAGMGYRHGFVQINRSVLVNVRAVESVAAEFSGNYTAYLRDGKTRLTISRKYMKAFRNYVMEVG